MRCGVISLRLDGVSPYQSGDAERSDALRGDFVAARRRLALPEMAFGNVLDPYLSLSASIIP